LARRNFHVIDLYDVYDGHNKADLMIAPWDDHPNAQAHALLADAISRQIQLNNSWFLEADPNN